MRVIFDARLVTYQRAGIGNYLLSLLAGLREIMGTDQIVAVTSRKDRYLAARWPDLRRKVVWTPPHHRLEQLALPIELALTGGDVYHAPDFIPPLVRLMPAVITVHDLAFLRWPELLAAEGRRYYGQVRRAVRSAARVIAVSEQTRQDLIALVDAPPRRIDVVHEAADPRFQPSSPAAIAAIRSHLKLPERYFLFVGTREPRKNLSRLLDAYARLGDRPGDPALVVAGQRGWLSDDLLEHAARLGLAGRLHVLGRVEDEELVPLYGGALALVFPSLYEGFGLPALEAMSCDTPVIASTGGSLPEIVADAGLLVDPFDVGGLAQAMRRLADEPSLRVELIERGRGRARRFSWRRAAEETLDVYRRAA